MTAEQINGPAPEYVTRQEFQRTIQQLMDSQPKPNRQKAKEAAFLCDMREQYAEKLAHVKAMLEAFRGN